MAPPGSSSQCRDWGSGACELPASKGVKPETQLRGHLPNILTLGPYHPFPSKWLPSPGLVTGGYWLP